MVTGDKSSSSQYVLRSVCTTVDECVSSAHGLWATYDPHCGLGTLVKVFPQVRPGWLRDLVMRHRALHFQVTNMYLAHALHEWKLFSSGAHSSARSCWLQSSCKRPGVHITKNATAGTRWQLWSLPWQRSQKLNGPRRVNCSVTLGGNPSRSG